MTDRHYPGRPVRVLKHQNRSAWALELRRVVQEARKRGDNRPPLTVISDWLQFRRRYED